MQTQEQIEKDYLLARIEQIRTEYQKVVEPFLQRYAQLCATESCTTILNSIGTYEFKTGGFLKSDYEYKTNTEPSVIIPNLSDTEAAKALSMLQRMKIVGDDGKVIKPNPDDYAGMNEQ